MLLKDIKLIDIDKSHKYDILIPLGSTEQHGPYIPFGTDTYITDMFVKRLNERFPELLIVPTLEYSCSKEHEGFLGTVWMEENTLKLVLRDVCNSLKDIAKSFIFYTGHGGNLHVIDPFIEEHGKDYCDIRLFHLQDSDEAYEEAARAFVGDLIDEHAGNTEISLLLSEKPELCVIPSKEDNKIVVTNPWKTGKLIDASKDGIADPHPEWIVSKEMGKTLRDSIADDLTKQLQKFLSEN